MKKKKTILMENYLTLDQLEAELEREKYKRRRVKSLNSTISVLVVVASIAVLLEILFFPIFRIYGSSMSPTVSEGEIVVALNGSSFECGEIAVLNYNNKLLVKRVIAGPGQWVDIDPEGNVYVDGKEIDEPYLVEKAYGDCNIKLPYQVPEQRYFVLGDNRSVSQDSRNALVGCIDENQIIGKVALRIWPLNKIAVINAK